MHREDPRALDAIEELATIARVLRAFGIVDAVDELQDLRVRPEACMTAAQQSLFFMGYHGEKWRDEPWFPRELERLKRRDGEVRFLISAQTEMSGLEKFRQLQKTYAPTLQVRLMNERSLFRMVCIDRHRLLLGHYGNEVINEDGTNAKGWKSPQLLVEQGSEWSLIIPFLMLHNAVWLRSDPLGPA